MTAPLMPKATAVWLVENTALTFEQIAEGEDYPLPATIDDPTVLLEIDRALATAGYARR